MRLGIFATTFPRDNVGEVFDAIGSYGLRSTQFDLKAAGLATLPDVIPDAVATAIREAATARDLPIAAVEGTFNMAHPDPAHRADGLRRLEVLAESCSSLGASMITLCTGTRDPDNMWRRHPDNTSPEAWRDMRAAVEIALQSAETYDLVLGVEPEISNVMSSAAAARRLLDELDSPRLKVIFDGANLFDAGDPERRLDRAADVLARAAELLGPDIALAHAKDVTADGTFVAAGQGGVPWDRYLRVLTDAGYTGALVLHSLAEQQVAESTALLQDILAAL